MEDFRADLHCHTTCSDGSMTPTELIRQAASIHLNGLSITDHDTINAYEEAVPLAKELQISLLSGVEFSSTHRSTSVHLLAYGFSLKSKIIIDFCMKHQKRRNERNKMMIDLLAARGMSLDESELLETSGGKQGSIGRPHIALAMIKRGYVENIKQAFNLYLAEGRPCYAQGKFFSVEETIDIIHQANGLAIIAHPHLVDDVKIIKDLLAMNFDGIEGYYGRFPKPDHERWLKVGKKNNWIITGGSDCHGTIKPNLPLGSSWVGQESFDRLQKCFLENNKD